MNNEQAMDWHTMSDEHFAEIVEHLKKKHEKTIQEHNSNIDDDMPF
jgi:predicted Fe-S protein YdhL (DUF1289 family)